MVRATCCRAGLSEISFRLPRREDRHDLHRPRTRRNDSPRLNIAKGWNWLTDVKCWDVQWPMSYVSVKPPTDPIIHWVVGSFGRLTNTYDMGHWTSQHLTYALGAD